MALAALARAHRLAVNGDVMRVLAFRETRGAQRLRQRPPIDGAEGFGKRRMTGRHAFRETERQELAFGQASTQTKRRKHSASSTQNRRHDQAQNRPKKVVLPLLAARIGLLIFVLALAGLAGIDLLGWVVTTSVWTDATRALGGQSADKAPRLRRLKCAAAQKSTGLLPQRTHCYGSGRWTWPPGETLRARLAMCGALGRASVNSGAANQRSQNDVDPFHKIPEREERRT